MSAFTATHPRSPLVTLMVGLACAQAACSLGSLDYLKNGANRDSGGETDNLGTSGPDTSITHDIPFDAIKSDGSAVDVSAIEAPLGPDSSGPDSSGPDSSGPDSPIVVHDVGPDISDGPTSMGMVYGVVAQSCSGAGLTCPLGDSC